jgi:hypothetical protein
MSSTFEGFCDAVVGPSGKGLRRVKRGIVLRLCASDVLTGCTPQDYFECLHHKKEVTRMNTIAAEYRRQEAEAEKVGPAERHKRAARWGRGCCARCAWPDRRAPLCAGGGDVEVVVVRFHVTGGGVTFRYAERGEGTLYVARCVCALCSTRRTRHGWGSSGAPHVHALSREGQGRGSVI